jgi:hypothetical protein
MIYDQSKGSLLDDAIRDRHQTLISGQSIKEKSLLLDNSTCGVEVPQVINLPSLDLDRYGSDDRIKGITTFVLLCWGAGLLAFLAYVFTTKEEIFQKNSWETYQVAAQVVCTQLEPNKPC